MESRAIEAADDPARQARLAVALTREAESLADLKQTDAALELLDKAVRIWSKLWPTRPLPAGVARGTFRITLGAGPASPNSGQIRRRRKTRCRARGVVEGSMLRTNSSRWPARKLSRAAVIGYGKTDCSTPQGDAVRQLGLDQAAANLRLALTMGYSDLGTLRV